MLLASRERLAASVARPAIFGGSKSLHCAWVWPTRHACSKFSYLSQRRWEWVIICVSSGRRDAMRSSFELLAYANLGKESQAAYRCAEKYMKVKKKSFCRWPLQLHCAATNSKGHKYSVCVIRTSFCKMQHINDPSYLPVEHGGPRIETEESRCRAESCSYIVWSWLQNAERVQVLSWRNIKVREELFVDYGVRYSF